jgi:outer membrane protein OmpA-like peptidoglycan-associated protein
MKIVFYILTVFFTIQLQGQTEYSGVWHGIIFPDGQAYSSGSIIWLSIQESDGRLEGLSRNELFDTPNYALKKMRGSLKNDQLRLEEFVTIKKKATSAHSFCRLTFELRYNSATGYVEGSYASSDCRNFMGKVILIKSEHAISEDDKMTLTHAWAKKLIEDLMKGKAAPHIRALERENFQFTPIYFDYDEHFIRPEYEDYLKKMAAIVLDHSDLRIQVTGHTDGDGSDEYNMALSERRARVIREFFVGQGLKEDRIEIDFKGKRVPVAPNETKEGMQLNRRVDFKFI